MKLAVLIIVLVAVATGEATRALNPKERLHYDLLTNYVKEVPPQKTGNSSITVNFGVAPMWLSLTDQFELESKIWGRYTWTDYRLTWDPEDYDGVTAVRMDTANLWTPDIVPYTKGRHMGKANQPQRREGSFCGALVYSSGMVLWVPEVDIRFMCSNDEHKEHKGLNMDDPWAEQHCSLVFGSWTYSGHEIDLQFYNNKTFLDLTDFREGSPIQINTNTAVRQTKFYDCCDEPYISLKYDISFQRKYIVASDGVNIVRNPKLNPNPATKERIPYF